MSEQEKNVPSKEEKSEDKSVSKTAGEKTAKHFGSQKFDDTPLSLEALFKAGVYFGHKRARRNPRMDEYVYAYRQGVAIIDLKKTMECFQGTLAFLEEVAFSGKPILFVGTKKHVRTLTREVADRVEMPFVNNRWLGGTFTNLSVIQGRVKYLLNLEEKLKKDDFSGYTKLEKLKKREESEKMDEKLGGLRLMKQLPGAVVVSDIKNDHLAIKEAKRAGVPIVALVDTNDDPRDISYIIPANNDALSSVRILMEYIAQSIEKGKKRGEKKEEGIDL